MTGNGFVNSTELNVADPIGGGPHVRRLTSRCMPQQLKPPAADGEVVFCKNNVCVHPPVSSKNGVTHHPGYLTIKVHHDEVLGLSLRLSWIPNASLKKNPRSLENRTPCSSPCRSPSVCTSVCPSPTVHHRQFRRGSTSSGNQPAPDEGSTCHLSCDQQSISSAISDMGSPPEEQGSLDSWTASDQAEMTASTAGSPPGLPLDSSDGDLCGIGTSATVSKMPSCDDNGSVSGVDCNGSSSSAIGPEEVTAALESMISGLNQIDTASDVGARNSVDSKAVAVKESAAMLVENGENVPAAPERNGTAISDTPWKDAGDVGPGGDTPYGQPWHSEWNGSIDDPSSSRAKPQPESLRSMTDSGIASGPAIMVSRHSGCSSADLATCESGRSSGLVSSGSSEGPDSGQQSPFPGEDSSNQLLERLRSGSRFMLEEGTPEQLAHAHNLTFPDNASLCGRSPSRSSMSRESPCGQFSVDLGQMRSLRLLFSNRECTSGQLVIASRESQYKIFHFHHGGLERLAPVLGDFDFLTRGKARKNEHCPYDHFSVSKPQVSAEECHPEEGLYSTLVDEDTWRQYMNDDGSIDDDFQLRKAIFFRGLDPRLRREAWPLLLQHYAFTTTFEEREQIRNDRFLEYQDIRKLRERMSLAEREAFWRNVECTVEKDVVRTDRTNPFYAGDNNPNIEIMKNILLNYAACNPNLGYTQGMSDLLAPVLAEIQDESEAFWCFVGLMQRTIFVSSPKDGDMDLNLEYMRELLRLMTPRFYAHLESQCEHYPDALELLFVHRWLVLCFKREFAEPEALQMWEACWARYQTDWFHLFLGAAIVALYGGDVVDQGMRPDEMLLHFSSLAGHMDGDLVLRKARGLLHQFRLLPCIPCTLAGLCELCGPGMWDSGHEPVVECRGGHGGRSCPHRGQDPVAPSSPGAGSAAANHVP
ncbi:TBC1 domain family member 16 isoform X1 [Dermacentor andersoni]|uniref:TBC1 domain family member 16 isoform X1 n=1 Tax=Dermacentor andersoni TaxID=34620 RepID=UPI002416E0C4|nr:TBC1 domain family member 16-like isoform X1 [Dermacentor andersoni]